MNRSYFLTLLFILLCVGIQVEAIWERGHDWKWKINNTTGKNVAIKVLIAYGSKRVERGKDDPHWVVKRKAVPEFMKYSVSQGDTVTVLFRSPVKPNVSSVNGKKVTIQELAIYDENRLAEYELTGDAAKGYVLNPAKK